MVPHLYRVTIHLENLEKSGNSKVVREKSGKMEKVREKSGGSEIEIFSLKFTKYRLAAGLCPDPLGELLQPQMLNN